MEQERTDAFEESSDLLPEPEFTDISMQGRTDSTLKSDRSSVSFAPELEEEIPFTVRRRSAASKSSAARNTAASNKRPIPRLVVRDLPFDQSRNKLQVRHKQGVKKLFMLLRHDWFHVIARLPMYISVAGLLAIWTGALLLFALFYYGLADDACGLGVPGTPIGFGGSFAFSLETATTVGYSLPAGNNSFFAHCPHLQAFVYFQMTWSMMFNAFLFAFFYSRLAQCDARGCQVVFSRKAIVTMVDGHARFQVRVYDADAANPVIEAHVRLYAVTKDRAVPRPLRIHNPDDELGGMLFLSVPAVVSHQVDMYSVLHPPVPKTPVPSAGLILRQADSVNCSREEVICAICGESYGTYKRWRDHVLYQRIVETKDDYPVQGTHLSLDESAFTQFPTNPSEYISSLNNDELRDYFEREVSEVICVVEGIEPIGSGTFAALHSYRFEDIVFNSGARFRPCVEAGHRHHYRQKHRTVASWFSSSSSDYMCVDLDRFHGIDVDTDISSRTMSTRMRNIVNVGRSLRAHDAFFSDEKTPLSRK